MCERRRTNSTTDGPRSITVASAALCLASAASVLLSSSSSSLAAVASAQYLSAAGYSYQNTANYGGQARDPASWGDITTSATELTLSYPQCANKPSNFQQSPIAITTSVVDPALQPFTAITEAYPAITGGITTANWWFNGADLKLQDFNAASLMVDPEEAFADKTLEYISFHLGAGHAIGGTHADLEISMVFSAHESITKTLTIVSVIATSGSYSSHRFLSDIIDQIPPSWGMGGANGVGGSGGAIPPAAGRTSKVAYVKGKQLDIRQLMPGRRAYYTYMGSEAMPPCRPARWYLMETPLHVSHQQIALLRNRTGAAGVPPRADLASQLVGNHRPVQSLISTGASGGMTVVRRYEEIFVPTVFDDMPSHWRGEDNVLAMGICAIVFGCIGGILAGYVIYTNWVELMKLPQNYGVGADKSLMESIQESANHNSNNAGGGGVGGDPLKASRRQSSHGSKKEKHGEERRYLKGLPAAAKPRGGKNNAAGGGGGFE